MGDKVIPALRSCMLNSSIKYNCSQQATLQAWMFKLGCPIAQCRMPSSKDITHYLGFASPAWFPGVVYEAVVLRCCLQSAWAPSVGR